MISLGLPSNPNWEFLSWSLTHGNVETEAQKPTGTQRSELQATFLLIQNLQLFPASVGGMNGMWVALGLYFNPFVFFHRHSVVLWASVSQSVTWGIGPKVLWPCPVLYGLLCDYLPFSLTPKYRRVKSLTRKFLAPTLGSVKKIISLVFGAAKVKLSPLHLKAAIKCHVLHHRKGGSF